MINKRNLFSVIIISVLFIVGCAQKEKEKNIVKDPLPSWNEGATKASILNFIEDVTSFDSENYVKIEDRIATFDNDGNLWSEQPFYFQLQFALDRIKVLAPNHLEWQEDEVMKAAIDGNVEEVLSGGHKGILKIVMHSHAGITTEEFESVVKDWLKTAKHPRFNKPYNQLIYQPMLELIDYLKANGFKVFIVSGGGIEFMRAWVEDAYDIPKDQVIGSSIKTQFYFNDGKPVIKRLSEIDFINDKSGKPVGINKYIGRKPVFASGNSDGDLQMMQWTASGEGKRFMLYLQHTDSIREWAYDRASHIGRLDKGLDEANKNGWTVIDMKKDWKVVYPFEIE